MKVPATIAQVLDEALAQRPDHEALVTRSARLSYRGLDAAAGRTTDALWRIGVRPGHTIAVSLPNDADIIVLFHAAMRLGAIWVGLNRVLAADEKRYMIDDAGASWLFADAEMAAQLRPVLGGGIRIVEVAAGDVVLGRDTWAAGVVDRPTTDIDPFAPAALAYTSGTTGRPKGVVHSQHNLLVPGAVLVATRGYGPDLRKGDNLALTILNMLVLTTLLTAQAGGTCVVIDRMDAAGITGWIRDERITTWNGVPAILTSMADDPAITPADLVSLSEVWTGGDSCPQAIADAFHRRFGHRLTTTYGLTEAPTIVSIDPVGRPGASGASGQVLPHLVVTIRDDDDRALPLGEVGEVCVEATSAGPWAGVYRPMLGYLHHDEATASTLRGGRLHTGDVGSLDADGMLTIRSRRSAVIIRGGANVYPAEVERVIVDVPGVAGCVVFGVPDERLGQRVAAAIEPVPGATPTPDAVLAACREQLARYKVPDQVTVVERLPRNAMGKVDRVAVARL